jgi:glycosyltransferase involved in cell wall biosynthesis
VAAGHEVSVVYESPVASAPFHALNKRGFEHLWKVDFWSGHPPAKILKDSIGNGSDVLVIASWGSWSYLRFAQQMPKSTLKLVGVDTPWRASTKQVIGQFTHRRILPRIFNGAWVTGLAQRRLVVRLGFQTSQIFDHLYCCDSELFISNRDPSERLSDPFLFVGRLVEDKGVRELVRSYGIYRKLTRAPRPLRIVGNGPISVADYGIEALPFADPQGIRELMDTSYALIHPARLEHWGVVVHEAASMGLPMVLSPNVNAGSRFLFQGINGEYGGPEVDGLADALIKMDRLGSDKYRDMSVASAQLGGMLNLPIWVDNFERNVERLRNPR